jgi:peptidoglycan/xylan/chitin deacetylase (PgdA/CDA1 family)
MAALRPPAFQVLTYHRVNDEADPFFASVPTPVFERHMAHIARAYRVLPLEEMVACSQRGSLPRNALAITFDDGYRDTLTHAAPVLERLGLPATIFLATGFIGTPNVAWSDRLAMALKTTTTTLVATPWGSTLSLASRADRLGAFGQIVGYLKGQPDGQLNAHLDRLLGGLGGSDQPCFKGLMLDWDDVTSLAGLGFSVGAHTVNHPILSRISPDRAWIEIEGSRAMIDAACGRSPRAFAYPNGTREDYTEGIAQMVRKAGFACAVTTRFGLNTATTPLYELRRGGPWEHDLALFACKLAGYRLISAARETCSP